jgi:hypothetical protein
MDTYSKIYQRIVLHRKNQVASAVWQNLFFDTYLEDKYHSDVDDILNDDNTNNHNQFYWMPPLDGELDGFDECSVVPYSV